jgi:uncharacterized protein (DUF111 family)
LSDHLKHIPEVALAEDARRRTYDKGPRIAYLDCFSGISGDMFLGALVDAGVPAKLFADTVAKLNIGATLEINPVNRSGISATKVDVIVDGKKEPPGELNEPGSHHDAVHAHAHSHDHEHAHVHQHDVGAPGLPGSSREAGGHTHLHGRSLTEIRKSISSAAISESAKRTAIAIFEKLGTAEAKIHNVSIEKIHFHEVGAVDAIVDIVCAAVGAEALGVDEFVCSALNVGGGTVNCAHGSFPVPAPATVEILKGAPVYSGEVQKELVTPTGAAIVATLATRFESFPNITINKTGYGAGSRDFPKHPNVLRIVIGDVVAQRHAGEGDGATPASPDTITVLEANLDDMNPQIFGYVME